jgi:release factor glutamine methyltransferase
MNARSTVSAGLVCATRRLEAAGIGSARLEAECLVSSLLGCHRLRLYQDPSFSLGAEEENRLNLLIGRRLKGEPLQYLVGRQEFWGLEFRVGPGVLIPRPETEGLVEAVVRRAQDRPVAIAEAGSGTGCIAVALATALPKSSVTASDRSATAVLMARQNAETHGVADRVSVIQGDWLDPMAPLAGRFDFVVSNPPYIPTAELPTLPPEVRHEPVEALDGGPDGMLFYRRLVNEAGRFLKTGGFLVVELGHDQSDRMADLTAGESGWARPLFEKDLAGIDRVAVIQWTGY